MKLWPRGSAAEHGPLLYRSRAIMMPTKTMSRIQPKTAAAQVLTKRRIMSVSIYAGQSAV